MTRPDVRIRRVYDEVGPGDGARVLVDRVWPRGLRTDAVQADDWAKDVAPSTELRWFGHDPDKFGESAPATALSWTPHRTCRARPASRAGRPRSGDAADRHPRRDPQPCRGPRRTHPGLAMTDPRPPHPDADRDSEPNDGGGDEVCWLARVCPECGRLADHEPPARCGRCGAPIAVD